MPKNLESTGSESARGTAPILRDTDDSGERGDGDDGKSRKEKQHYLGDIPDAEPHDEKANVAKRW